MADNDVTKDVELVIKMLRALVRATDMHPIEAMRAIVHAYDVLELKGK